MVYELYYHPGFTGRLEPILTLLADAGIKYEINRETLPHCSLHELLTVGLAGWSGLNVTAAGCRRRRGLGGTGRCRCASLLLSHPSRWRVHAGADTSDHGVSGTQARLCESPRPLVSCCLPLPLLRRLRAAVHVLIDGLRADIPAGVEEQANCLQLALNAADIWSEAYSARRADEDAMKTYLSERLPRWLDTLELFHDKTSNGGVYFFGDEPTYADFELLNSLNILDFMFGFEEFGDTLDAWKDAMESRPGVSAYLASCEPVLYPQVAKM